MFPLASDPQLVWTARMVIGGTLLVSGQGKVAMLRIANDLLDLEDTIAGINASLAKATR